MIGRILAIAPVVCLAACAASGPEVAPTSAAAPGAASATVPGNQEATPGEEFYAMKTPSVPPTMVGETSGPGTGVICRDETETGTHLTKHVCRSAAAIEARKERDQEMVQDWIRRALR